MVVEYSPCELLVKSYLNVEYCLSFYPKDGGYLDVYAEHGALVGNPLLVLGRGCFPRFPTNPGMICQLLRTMVRREALTHQKRMLCLHQVRCNCGGF